MERKTHVGKSFYEVMRDYAHQYEMELLEATMDMPTKPAKKVNPAVHFRKFHKRKQR